MNVRIQKLLFIVFLVLWFLPSLNGQNIYVSPSGNDINPGTKIKPIASFAHAQTLARKYTGKSPVKVYFAEGTYYLPQTVKFTADDNKTDSPVTYMAQEEGKAILSGGSLLHLNWRVWKNGIYVAEVPKDAVIDQLYINGQRQRMARFPNAMEGKNVYDAWDLENTETPDPTNDPLTTERIARWKHPEGGYIHAMHSALWGDMHWIIKGKNPDGKLVYEGGWQNNRPSEMHPRYRMVENIFEELDVPTEWYFNATEGKLYYMPDASTNLKTAKVEIVRLSQLVEFSGTKENSVKSIHLEGFVFRHAARTFMDNKEPLLRSDWTIYRGGAVVFNGAEDCFVDNCEFDQVGGNTIFVNNFNRRITIRGCYIHNSGASGIVFVGDPAMVRSPLFEYGDRDYSIIDRTPGPKSDNFPEDCLVENCLITLTGRDEKQTAPIQISMSHKIRINHCTIYDVPRSGININEGTFGGHVIENCDIFNTVLETGDHGSFNSWGRDRYWSANVKLTSDEVAKTPRMQFWDMLEPNIIRNNRWRCDHGWAIDLDDGSSQYRIYNNLLLNGGLKLREGYDRIATNNIIVNSSLHPHAWYVNSGDVFKNNIVFTQYWPAAMEQAIASDGKWGKELDFNFFVSDKQSMMKYAINGCDAHSLNGDPLFVDASKGDFRVKEGSPALALGFENFPLDSFGVTKPSLKAIAKKPLLPTVTIQPQNELQKKEEVYSWMGVLLKEPSGAEMSAYGVGFDAGGVALTSVTVGSEAEKLGFRTGDLIQEVNGEKIHKIKDLKEYIESKTDKLNHFVFVVIRNQIKTNVLIDKRLTNIIHNK